MVRIHLGGTSPRADVHSVIVAFNHFWQYINIFPTFGIVIKYMKKISLRVLLNRSTIEALTLLLLVEKYCTPEESKICNGRTLSICPPVFVASRWRLI